MAEAKRRCTDTDAPADCLPSSDNATLPRETLEGGLRGAIIFAFNRLQLNRSTEPIRADQSPTNSPTSMNTAAGPANPFKAADHLLDAERRPSSTFCPANAHATAYACPLFAVQQQPDEGKTAGRPQKPISASADNSTVRSPCFRRAGAAGNDAQRLVAVIESIIKPAYVACRPFANSSQRSAGRPDAPKTPKAGSTFRGSTSFIRNLRIFHRPTGSVRAPLSWQGVMDESTDQESNDAPIDASNRQISVSNSERCERSIDRLLCSSSRFSFSSTEELDAPHGRSILASDQFAFDVQSLDNGTTKEDATGEYVSIVVSGQLLAGLVAPPTGLVSVVVQRLKRGEQLTSEQFSSEGEGRSPLSSTGSHLTTALPSLEEDSSATVKADDVYLDALVHYLDSSVSATSGQSAPTKLPLIALPRNHPDYITDEVIPTSMADITRDCLYMLQGIDGKMMRLTSDNQLCFDSAYCIDMPVRRVLARLSEYGHCYVALEKFSDQYLSASSNGAFLKAIASAIQPSLNSYLTVIAEALSQLLSGASGGMSEDGQDAMITPEWLQWKLFSFRPTLFTIRKMIQEVSDVSPSVLLEKVFHFTKFADPGLCGIMEDVMCSVCQVLKRMITVWMFEGKVKDLFDEFFIYQTVSSDISADWADRGRLKEELVPRFLGLSEARTILTVGNSIAFLRNICKDPSEIPAFFAHRIKFEHLPPSVLFKLSEMRCFSEHVSRACELVSRVVLDTLNSRFDLLFHLKAVNQFILLARGDFAKHLVEVISTEAERNMLTINAFDLFVHLDLVLRDCTPSSVAIRLLSAIEVDFLPATLEPDAADIDDSLTITYTFPNPVAMVLSDNALVYSKRIFSFAWRVRRLDYLLSNTVLSGPRLWKALHTLKELPITQLWHRLCIISNELMSFVQPLQDYVFNSVIQSAFDEMMERLGKASDINCVTEAHDAYLRRIMKQLLLSDDRQDLLKHLRAVFHWVYLFMEIMKHFRVLLKAHLTLESDDSLLLTSDLSLNDITEVDSCEADGSHENSAMTVLVLSNILQTFREEYHKTISEFLHAVTNDGDPVLLDLRCSIDFGHWYELESSGLENSATMGSLNTHETHRFDIEHFLNAE